MIADFQVIVWGVDDHNTLALIRQIGQGCSNLHFLIIGKARYAAKSKYCTKYIETDGLEDSFHRLLHLRTNTAIKPIIVTNGDDVITFIDKHRHELLPHFIIPGCRKQGDIAWFIDKYNMTCLAEKVGMIVPKSKQVKWNSTLDDIVYPCFIKPSHQQEGHYDEFKFRYCKDQSALMNVLRCVRHDSVFIVQQYVKREKDLLVYGCRMQNGEIVLAGGLMTERFAVGQGSSYGVVSKCIHPSISIEKIKEFLQQIDYVGLFSFEYGLMGEKAYFFEINLRNDGTSHYFYNAGANIPLAYVKDAAGLNYNDVSTKVETDCNYMDEIFDVSNVFLGKVSFNHWKEQRAGIKAFKFYDSEDILPYTMAKKHKWIRIMRDIILKRYRPYILFALERIGYER